MLENSIFSVLIILSVWLGYLNYKLLRVSQDILLVTHSLNEYTITICMLTKAVVENTSMPSDMEWQIPPKS